MLKESFYNYLDNILNGMTFTEKKQTFENLTDLLREYSENLEKSYTTCPFCNKTFPNSSFIFHENSEVREHVFLDTPAAPNDFESVFGDVEYLVTYMKCPECHKIKEHSRQAIKILKTYLGELCF